MAIGTIVACCGSAFALNPSLDVSQYAHTSWRIRDGFPRGGVFSIAQTPDGYLWLGTEYGLVRFDGANHVDWQPPAGQRLPSNNIRHLLVTRDGTLWISTTNGLASWKDGELARYPEPAGIISGLLEDSAGSLWVSSWRLNANGKLCQIRSGHVQCFEQDEGSGFRFISLYRARNDAIWAGVAGGLLRWSPSPAKFYSLPQEVNGIQGFAEDDNGALLIGGGSGIRRFADGKIEPYSLPEVTGKFTAYTMLRDRDGGLWVGTNSQGLLHVHDGKTDAFGRAEGLSGDRVSALFEDREGDVWVATLNGLDRLRDYAVPTFSGRQGLSDSVVTAVAADRDGATWIASSDGLKRWNRGQVTGWRESESPGTDGARRSAFQRGLHEVVGTGFGFDGVRALFPDNGERIWIATLSGVGYHEGEGFTQIDGLPGGFIHALTRDTAGNLWIANQNLGLFRLSPSREVQQFSWSSLGPHGSAGSAVDDPRGGIWLGFAGGGISWYRDGRIQTSYETSDGLGRGGVSQLRFDSTGVLWAATEGGLSRLKNGRVSTLSGKNGLPCDTVHWSMEDDFHFFWLFQPCGLVRIDRAEMDAWNAAADKNADPNRSVHVRVFDGSDGVRTVEVISAYSPLVSKSPDGKLWFTALDGVSVIDPRRLAFNSVPPPVQIEQIRADRKIRDPAQGPVRLPALVRDVEIDYTALSLVAPEKMRFRYKLEGEDSDWRDAGTRRQAFYNDLKPRHYRFRVAASNNSGVWNEAGASLDFSVDPAYYQTRWFQAACVAAFFVLLWGLHRYRLHQIAQKFNMHLDGRVDERTRIARELHDTLLQSIQGLMLKLDAVTYLIRSRPDEAERVLDGIIAQTQAAVVEGREAVHDLRSSTTITNELAEALRDAGDELAAESGVTFRVRVEGPVRELRPIVRDELYRIAREALRNAFTHAHAQQIEGEITYADRSLRLRIRDDGSGISPSILKEGRKGHYGLGGMRERAEQIGAKLNIWSRVGAGTEVDLNIPGSIAYGGNISRSGFSLFRRKAG